MQSSRADIDNVAVRDGQIVRLHEIKQKRDTAQVERALAAITFAAENNSGNLLDLSIQAMRLRATVGEVSDALEKNLRAPPRRYSKGDRCVCSRL
ncbi:methylmalonyl-CoA mutase family protein [Polaromonas sp. P1(28)-13]|nr:methylmalonyl-CoA mutase family protein [Polaromonas sp. P1(28)-13]